MWAVQTPFSKLALVISVSLIISFCAIFADSKGIVTPLKSSVVSLTLPIVSKLSFIRQSVSDASQVIPHSFVAARQIDLLKKENNELRQQLAEVVSIAKENEVLKRELNVSPIAGASRTLGQVITLNDHMVVKLATPMPIKEGAAVTQNNNLVGFIAKPVTADLYAVTPVTATGFKAKVKIIHQGAPIDGIVEGQFGSHLKVTKILASTTVSENDIVVMDDAARPQSLGLILGKIDKTMKVETEVFQEATVLPFYEITTYNTVFVTQ